MSTVGYVLGQDVFHVECLEEEYRDAADAIFDNQDEWDCYPTCEWCKQEIGEVQLTTDGREWLHSTGRKQYHEGWSDAFREAGGEFFYAYYSNGNWYDLECFIDTVLGGEQEKIKQFYANMKSENVLATSNLDDCITEATVQYEGWPGQLIPLWGVYCNACGEELYAPYDTSQEEEWEAPDAAQISHQERF